MVRSLFSNHPPTAEWEKDEACECLQLLKQLVSLGLGLVWGLIPMQGVMGLGLYAVILCGVSYLWTAQVLGDDLLDLSEVLQEGTMGAVMAFLLVWTLVYTFVFF